MLLGYSLTHSDLSTYRMNKCNIVQTQDINKITHAYFGRVTSNQQAVKQTTQNNLKLRKLSSAAGYCYCPNLKYVAMQKKRWMHFYRQLVKHRKYDQKSAGNHIVLIFPKFKQQINSFLLGFINFSLAK